MTVSQEKTRIGLVVIKALAADMPYFLMRANPKWKDINFIGGHEKDRDGADLKKTARRELWEEVPSIRQYSNFDVEALTAPLDYGPIFSKSRGRDVAYEVQFFLLKLDQSPEMLVRLLSSRSRNIWVQEHQLLYPRKYRISSLLSFLNEKFEGGLGAIPYSFASDLRPYLAYFENSEEKQLAFALR